MPTDRVEAIVLRTADLGEQDKLAVFLTRERGVMRGVAKGARKFGNRFGSSLEPMSHVVVHIYEKERHDLVTVSGCDLVQSFFDVQGDPATSFALAYFAELAEEFVPARAREEIAFRLLLSVLRSLAAGGDRVVVGRYFEAWILSIHGSLPDVRRCRKCRRPVPGAGWLSPRKDGIDCDACATSRKDEVGPELGRFLGWARAHAPSAEAPFSPEELRSIERSLQAMIVFQLEREPRTLRFLRSAGEAGRRPCRAGDGSPQRK